MAETIKQVKLESLTIIGLKDPEFIWSTDTGTDGYTNDPLPANSGMTEDTFDTTSRADSARISLENTSGSTRTMRQAGIKGKLVLKMSGDYGFIHDSFVDYEDIYKNGEKKFELGNDYICTKDQVEKLADFHWKNFRAKRHIYFLSMTGTRYWFTPGEWYTLQIGGAGEQEYIDSVCECFSVSIERGVGELGQTNVRFREVYQNWVQNSNALARFVAQGDPKNIYDFGRVLIGAQEYIGSADIYCDYTSDEDEFNTSIDNLGAI